MQTLAIELIQAFDALQVVIRFERFCQLVVQRSADFRLGIHCDHN